MSHQPNDANGAHARALEFLRTRTNYEQLDRRGATLGLDPMRGLLAKLGHPEAGIRVVHVAGSKGKGSVTWFVDAFLRRAGKRVGRYLSPHLVRIEERIAIDGSPLDAEAFGEAVLAVAPYAEEARATFFDVLTAAAWVAFARARVEFVALETGLGGRLDSTNVGDKVVSGLTTIALEHTEILGTDLGSIATEKAHIARRGVPLYSVSPESSAAGAAIARVAAEIGAPLFVAGREFGTRNAQCKERRLRVDVETVRRIYSQIRLPTPALYQVPNLVLAVALVDELEAQGLLDDARAAIESPPGGEPSDLAVPGRFEVIEREGVPLVLDGAHTAESLAVLLDTLDQAIPARPRVVVFAASRDKDLLRLSSALAGRADLVLATQARSPRAAPASDLRQALERAGVRAREVSTVEDALDHARRETAGSGVVLVTGSLYLVGDALQLLGRPSR